jgi:type VI secretion system FHA domain protein
MQEWPPMTLTLTMLRCPDTVPPQTRTVPGGEFSIGRGPENDWVLPDPERYLSKRHCVLAFRAGGWQIADLSTNGTVLNRDNEPIGRAEPRRLRDGDRLRFGLYEIEARLAEAAEPLRRPAGSEPSVLAPAGIDSSRAPAPELFGQDPLLQPRQDADPFGVGLAPPSINLPPDYDPLAPEPVIIHLLSGWLRLRKCEGDLRPDTMDSYVSNRVTT